MRKIIGYILFIISILLWCLVPLIPFLSLSIGIKASLATSLILFAEVVWWLSLLLIGKELILIIKTSFLKVKEMLKINFLSNPR